MKLAVFDPYLDTLGGGEKYILKASSCLSDSHKVSLLWDNSEIVNKGEEKFGIDLKKVETVDNFFKNKFSLPKRFSLSKRFNSILYLSDGSIPLVGAKLFIHFQFPVKRQKENPFLSKLKIGRIKKVICNSFYTKKFIDKEFRVNSLVLYPPVEDFNSKKVKKENIILTVGRYNSLPEGGSFKKHEFLIETFKKLPKNDFQLIIVTSKEKKGEKYIEELRNLAKGFSIKVLEDVSREQLEDLYLKSKIYWHAAGFGEDLERHPERAEHFGITTVEAMLGRAVPVVVGVGGQKEIVENKKNGYLYDTQKELLEITGILMANEELIKNLGEKARERAKFFSGDRFCKEINEIIK